MLADSTTGNVGDTVNASSAELRDFSRAQKKAPEVRVLVVDDEPLIRWSLSETLADNGYQVVETADGQGARTAMNVAAREFDVVLLDLRLPDTEDLSLLASLRRLSPHAQIILMTAFGTPDVARGALELGAFRVVNKPFEMEDVASLVAQAHAARPH